MGGRGIGGEEVATPRIKGRASSPAPGTSLQTCPRVSPSPQPPPTALKVRPPQESLSGPRGMTEKKGEGIPWKGGLGGKGNDL